MTHVMPGADDTYARMRHFQVLGQDQQASAIR